MEASISNQSWISGTSWCSRSADGGQVICRRLGTDGVHRVDKAGIDYWLYRMNENLQPYHIAPEISVPRLRPLAPPDTLHQVYQALLGMLPLEQRHYQNLRQRGLSAAEITRRQYRTLPTRGRDEFARHLVNAFGSEVCRQIPGLYVKEVARRRWWSLAGAPGMVIPLRDLDGQIIGLKVRTDGEAPDHRYTAISSKNRGGPGSGALLHAPWHLGVTSDVIRVTEGEMKADIATALTDVLTIAVPGVSAWRTAILVLQRLQPLTIRLAFDADWRVNLYVIRALAAAASANPARYNPRGRAQCPG
jgi:hypothetical protein